MSAEMKRVPVGMSKDELLAVLDDIRARVAEGDSWEGSIEYLIPEEPSEAVEFAVNAGYRVGNSMGQGGFRQIGEWVGVAEHG